VTYQALQPKDAVVLFADLQAGIIEFSRTVEPDRLHRSVGALAKLAALFDIPAIVTAAPGDGGPKITPEIAAALGDHPTFVRHSTDAFLDPDTRAAILATKGARS
jgi:hypothetical protein